MFCHQSQTIKPREFTASYSWGTLVLILALALLANSVFAGQEVCSDAAKSVFESGSAAKTASSVFIDFARKHYGNNFDQAMSGRASKTWSERITLRSKTWEAEDAELFLNFLVEKIGVTSTLKRMKTFPSLFLQGMNYQRFSDTYTILSHWAGEEAVIEKMAKSLGGFQRIFPEDTAVYFLNFYRNDKSNPEDMIELLKTSLAGKSSEEVEILISSLSDIFEKRGRLGDFNVKNFLSRLKDDFTSLGISPDDASLFIDFMDDYLHSWNLTKSAMLQNFDDFVQIDTLKLGDAITWLSERGIPMDTIKEIFKGSIKAAKLANKDKLEHIAKHMQDFFGGENVKELVNSMMSQNLSAFIKIDTKKFDDAVAWLNEERGIPMETIREIFKRNISAASSVNKGKLEKVTGYMQDFFGGDNAKNDVDFMMLKNPSDFVQIDTKEFENVVTWLNEERGIPMETIKEIFKGNAEAAGSVNKDRLEKIAKHMQKFFGRDNAKNDVDFMILKNPGAFVQIDTAIFKDAVTWLNEERGIPMETLKEIFKENVSAASSVNKGKLKNIAGYMQDFIGGENPKKDVDSMMLKNPDDFVKIDTEKFDNVVTWLNEERDIPMDTIKKIFKGNIKAARSVNKNKLEKVAGYMQGFIGGENAKKDVDSMMLKNPESFVQIDTAIFKDAATWLNKERGIPMETVKEIFKENVSAASSVNKGKLKKIAGYMQDFIGGENAKKDVNSMMLKNPGAFVQIDTAIFKDAVTWLNEERGVPIETIKEIFKRNIKAASLVNKGKLKRVAGYMQDFIGGENAKKDVDSMMLKNPGSFVQIDTAIFKDAVTWLNEERGIPMETIKEIFKRNINAASLVNKGKLKRVAGYMQDFIGGENAKNDVDFMMLKNPGDFVQIDTATFKDAVTWLNEERGILMDIIKETFKENISGAYQVSKEKLEHVAKYMQDFIGGENAKKDVNSMILKNPESFVQIDTATFKDAVTWLNEERDIRMDTIKEVFKRSIDAAVLVSKDKLEKVAGYMQDFIGGENAKKDVNSMMLQNPGSFVQIDTATFKDAVTWLNEERGIPMDIIKETFKGNTSGAHQVSKEKLEHVAKYMQDFIRGENAKKDVNSMMLKNPESFVQIDTSEFGEAITWLITERNIPESLIKEAFRKNVKAAMIISNAKLETLALEMDKFFSGKKIDLDSLLEKITEKECRTLTNILCP